MAEAAVRIWDIEAVQEALIQCHELWRRSPGNGRWPFAGDGPWHLMQGEVGDYAGDGQDAVSSSARPRTPLDSGEVAERDRVTGWLELVPEAQDRMVVHQATLALWQGEPRPPWKRIGQQVRWGKSMDGLAWRYRKALALIVCRLNGWPSRRAQMLAAR